MNCLSNSTLRLTVELIAAAGWLAVSNHCALAALEATPKMSMSCHGSGQANHAPAKQDKRGSMECCKVLRATLATPSPTTVSEPAAVVLRWEFSAGLLIRPDV